jgi:hypothetical protein
MSDTVSGSRTSPVRTKRMDIFLLLLLIASLSLNVYLGWKVKQTKPTLSIERTIVSTGTKLDPITAVSMDGKQLTISYEATDKPTVFYVLSPTCIWCERNKANLDTLTRLKGNDFRFIGLSLGEAGLKEYVERQFLNFPVYTKLTPGTINSLGLGGTPQTIVISPEGRVLKNWIGAYTEHLQPELEEYFQISLPGLTAGSH